MFKTLLAFALATVAAAQKAVSNTVAKVAAIGTGLTIATGSAMAQTATNPIVAMLESVDLTTVAAAIAVIGLIVVAIALTMKGPDVAKRVIRKV